MPRYGFWVLWLGFITYAFILSPPDQPDTFELIKRLSTGDWDGLNPAFVALFNGMGLWPMVYAAVALIDGHGQPQRAWPFVVGSFAVGAFAILPYLALRAPASPWAGPKPLLLRLLDARLLGAVLTTGAIALVVYGLFYGDWPWFWQQWQTSRFVHVTTLDFGFLWLLFPVLMRDDMARRGLSQGWLIPMALVLPLVGACLYLMLRPPLPDAIPASDGT
jgi:hypothetical protein